MRCESLADQPRRNCSSPPPHRPQKLPTPSDIVASSPASAWKAIPADDLLVMDLANGGRIVIQLAPAFAPVHVANIKALARGRLLGRGDGLSGAGQLCRAMGPERERQAVAGRRDAPSRPPNIRGALRGLSITPLGSPDAYAPRGRLRRRLAGRLFDPKAGRATSPIAMAASASAATSSPDTGTGGELYAVIGQAPRQLDRNIALVGRVVEGIDRLSSLPRGTGDSASTRTRRNMCRSRASAWPATCRRPSARPSNIWIPPAPTFARYLKLRANRHDAFYDVPAGGVDLCNVQVPVRKGSRDFPDRDFLSLT